MTREEFVGEYLQRVVYFHACIIQGLEATAGLQMDLDDEILQGAVRPLAAFLAMRGMRLDNPFPKREEN